MNLLSIDVPLTCTELHKHSKSNCYMLKRRRLKGVRPKAQVGLENILKWRAATPGYQNEKKNPAWKGGTARISIHRLTLKLVQAHGLDIYTCSRCGESGRANIHHKDRDLSNNTIDNLEILCAACHAHEHLMERQRKGNGQWAS